MIPHCALLIHEGPKVLFAKRSASKKHLPNMWALPSGTLLPGESLEDAGIREAREELGVEIRVEHFVGDIDLPEFAVRLRLLACVIVSGTPSIAESDEIQDIAWLTFEEFFKKHADEEIGHGLRYLRRHPEMCEKVA